MKRRYSTRFDLKVTKKDVVTVRYEYQKQDFVNSLAQTNGFTGDIPASSKNFGGIWTRTISNSMVQRISRLLSEDRSRVRRRLWYGYLRLHSGTIGYRFGSLPQHYASGYSAAARCWELDRQPILPQGRIGKVYQVADNLSWTKGKHSFIFGGEYKHLNEVSPFLPNFNGQFGFNSAARLTATLHRRPSA